MGLARKTIIGGSHLKKSVAFELREVSDKVITIEGGDDTDDFLGIPHGITNGYVKSRTKIIKSKITGKTYTIKKISIIP